MYDELLDVLKINYCRRVATGLGMGKLTSGAGVIGAMKACIGLLGIVEVFGAPPPTESFGRGAAGQGRRGITNIFYYRFGF